MATATPDTMGNLRQRSTASSKTSSTGNGEAKSQSPKTGPATASSTGGISITILDIFRAIAGVAVVSTIASYMVTQGESFIWGIQRPWWTHYKQIERAIKGPLLLTNDELSAYDGSVEGTPIYLALNRTIYDMSASPHIYGPGAMYSALAAKDASRAYITTCFDPVDDLVPYFGGVEEIYVPLWLSRKPLQKILGKKSRDEIVNNMDADDLVDRMHKKVGRKNIKKLQDEAYRNATLRVRETVRGWETMFAKKGYPVVGRVVGVDDHDENKWRHLEFCEKAMKLRPGIAESLQAAMESIGKGDQLNINLGKLGGQSNEEKNKKTKKKYGKGKKKQKDGEEGQEQEKEETPEEKKKAAKLEDMLEGGQYGSEHYPNAPSPEEILQSGPYGNDPEGVERAKRLAKEQIKKKTEEGDIPDAIPEEALEEEDPLDRLLAQDL